MRLSMRTSARYIAAHGSSYSRPCVRRYSRSTNLSCLGVMQFTSSPYLAIMRQVRRARTPFSAEAFRDEIEVRGHDFSFQGLSQIARSSPAKSKRRHATSAKGDSRGAEGSSKRPYIMRIWARLRVTGRRRGEAARLMSAPREIRESPCRRRERCRTHAV